MSIISEIRKLQDISQAELAQRAGINQSSVARWEAGIPAIAENYIAKVCKILSIEKHFLEGKSEYPFLSKSFLIFKIQGLKARVNRFKFIEYLFPFSKELKILLLLNPQNKVLSACMKDDHGTIFLVLIYIPLMVFDVIKYFEKLPEKDRNKVMFKTDQFFCDKKEFGIYRTTDDIRNFSKDDVEKLIDESFLDFLSDKEKEIIKLIRQREMLPDEVIKKLQKKK